MHGRRQETNYNNGLCKMTDTYSKILKKPEARHRYWHVLKEERDFFPDAHETFTLKFHDKKYTMKVNHKDDIMTGQLYATHQFLEGHRIEITKKGEKSYELDAPDTDLYPEVG